MEHVETYGYFTPCSVGSLTGKMGTRPVELALRLADRGYILESGRTILTGSAAALLQSPEVKRIFLGDIAL